MIDEEIRTHSRARQWGLCSQMSPTGMSLPSGKGYFDNFICAVCWQALAELIRSQKGSANLRAR